MTSFSMELAMIDNYAVGGRTPLHRASTISKVFFTCILFLGILRAESCRELLLPFALAVGVLLLSRFPLARLFPLLFLPAFFGGVFALGRLGFEAGPSPILAVGKAVLTAFSLLLLLLTTPLPKILALLGAILPPFLVNALYFTYRSFFLLWEGVDNLLLIYKLRGGYSPQALFTNLLRMGPVLGVLVLHSLESMEGFSWTLALRGGGTNLGENRIWEGFGWEDLYPLLLGIILLVVIL